MCFEYQAGYCDGTPESVPRSDLSLTLHSLAASDVAVGTLRQSIQLALDMMVVRAMTLTFRQLDNDFNLSLLKPLMQVGERGYSRG